MPLTSTFHIILNNIKIKIFIFALSVIISCDKNSISNCSNTDCLSYFNLNISDTGESTLFIFNDSISSLQNGDEIGLFDENGIIDETGQVGNILVGYGVWDGSQLEIVAIMSQDLSSFGGAIFPGAINGNELKLKIWKKNSQILKDNVIYTIEVGSGTFNALFTAISELSIQV